jgi:hypothetical protein
MSISRWKTLGLHVSPNGMTVYRQQPLLVTKAVLSRSLSATGMLWYPARKSSVENQVEPDIALMQLSMSGSG